MDNKIILVSIREKGGLVSDLRITFKNMAKNNFQFEYMLMSYKKYMQNLRILSSEKDNQG